jgi:ADP-heptose:LPS heptosyltransferase
LPGAEFGPAKRWPPSISRLAARFLRDGLQVWVIGSPRDGRTSARDCGAREAAGS